MTNYFRTNIAFCLIYLAGTFCLAQEVQYAESFEPNGQYNAQWCVDGDMLRMRLEAQAQGWLAIGFSDNQLMPNTDVIMLTGEGVAQDAFADRRSAPIPDDQQDITVHSTSEDGGFTVVEFSRPIQTMDDEGDFSLDQDRFLLWVIFD